MKDLNLCEHRGEHKSNASGHQKGQRFLEHDSQKHRKQKKKDKRNCKKQKHFALQRKQQSKERIYKIGKNNGKLYI